MEQIKNSDSLTLEEAAEEYSKKVSDGHNFRDLRCGFIAGAEWQKEQDNNFERYKEYTDNALISLEEAREQGGREMKEQIMKYAVEAEVTDVGLNYLDLALFEAESLKLKDGDKVHIIVVKDESK
jgi:hypothetical protein